MANFTLLILEYTDSDNLISCEQKWIDLLKPEYNLNPLAGNTKGYKHTLESLEKMKNRVVLSETKTKMSLSAKKRLKREGKLSPFEGKKHTEKSLALLRTAAKNRKKLPVPGIKVEITDIETNQTTTYDSIRSAANGFGTVISSVLN
jgi:group I intron endonuclease